MKTMILTEKETKLKNEIIFVQDNILSCTTLIQLENCLNLIDNLCYKYSKNRKIIKVREYLLGFYDAKFLNFIQ